MSGPRALVECGAKTVRLTRPLGVPSPAAGKLQRLLHADSVLEGEPPAAHKHTRPLAHGADTLLGVRTMGAGEEGGEGGEGGGRRRKKRRKRQLTRASWSWEPAPCRDWGKGTLTQALSHHRRVKGIVGGAVSPRTEILLPVDQLCDVGHLPAPLCASVFSSMTWRGNL